MDAGMSESHADMRMDAGMNGLKFGSVPLLAAICAATTFAATAAYAQTLRDPTRPPSFSESAQAGELRGEGRASQGPLLQSVIVSRGRKLALIDGRTYTIGDKVGEAKLVVISASEVTLRESGVNKILRLTPDAQKTSAHPAVAKAGSRRSSHISSRAKEQKGQ